MPDQPEDTAAEAAPIAARAGGTWNIRLYAVVIPLIALTVFLPTVRFGWIGWDDEAYVTANPLMTEPGGLARIWFSGESDQYYPLTFTTFWVEYQLWQRSPAGYHLINVLLHAANALLLLVFLRALGVSRRTACLVCLLFAVHPLQTMSVAWIAQRKNLLSCLFSLIALLAWIRFRRHDDERWYLASLAAFAAALLSKTAVLTLPLAVAALDGLLLKVRFRSTAVRVVPMLLLAVTALAVTSSFEQAFLDDASIPPLSVRPLIAGAGICFYTLKAVVPVDLLPIYPRWHVSLGAFSWWFPLLLLVAVGLWLWHARRILGGQILFGIIFFLVFLLPSSGLVAFGNMDLTFVSDHYVYIACIGLFLASATGLERLPRGLKLHPRVATLAAFGMVAVLSIASFRYSPVFENAHSMWTRTLSGNPGSFTANSGLGQYHATEKAWADAVEYYGRAVEIKPEAHDVRRALGQAQIELGDLVAAETNLRIVADAQPLLTEPLLGLAFIAERTGRPRAAVDHYKAAIHIDPQDVDAHIRLGRVYLGFNNRAEAARHFGLAIQLESNDPWPYLGLATSQRGQGEAAEAVRTLESGLRLAPGNVPLINLLARILATTPDDDVRDGTRALALALQASKTTGHKDCLTLDTLAAAYAAVGDFTKAAATAEAAARTAESLGYSQTARTIRANAVHYRDGSALRESSTNLALR